MFLVHLQIFKFFFFFFFLPPGHIVTLFSGAGPGAGFRIQRPHRKNERCEQIAQVAHQKEGTMSDSLRSLTKNELMSELLVFLSESLVFF